jgi:predicted dehydrogenase
MCFSPGGPNAQGKADAVEFPVRHRGHVAHVHAALAAGGLHTVHTGDSRRQQSTSKWPKFLLFRHSKQRLVIVIIIKFIKKLRA